MWNETSKKWIEKQHGFIIERLYFGDHAIKERFYLWLFSMVVRRPYLFKDFYIINEVLQLSLKNICLKIGLLGDNKE